MSVRVYVVCCTCVEDMHSHLCLHEAVLDAVVEPEVDDGRLDRLEGDAAQLRSAGQQSEVDINSYSTLDKRLHTWCVLAAVLPMLPMLQLAPLHAGRENCWRLRPQPDARSQTPRT